MKLTSPLENINARPDPYKLLPLATDGLGPRVACTRFVDALHLAKSQIDVWGTSKRVGGTEVAPLHRLLSGEQAQIPCRLIVTLASRAFEPLYSSSLAEGDVAWLWPAVLLKTHEFIYARGNLFFLDSINTRLGVAKRTHDAAYEELSAPPIRGITKNRIREEDAKIALARTIFADTTGVEDAHAVTYLASRFIRSSYGSDTSRPGRPRLIGHIEPPIAARYADIVESDEIEIIGFSHNPDTHYSQADVFVCPSLEERGPQVVYDAAHHGFPLLTSRLGSGRIGLDRGSVTIVDPADKEAFLSALLAFWRYTDLRVEKAGEAQSVSVGYNWDRMAAARAAALSVFLDKDPVSGTKDSVYTPAAPLVREPAPSITVVLPTYNRERTIRRSIESVLRQTWEDFELLVVDDCSTDNTREVVHGIADPRIRLIESPKNLGPSCARNAGVEEARSDLIAFQDSDDEWLPLKLERQIARLCEPHCNWIAAYCGMVVEGNLDQQLGVRTQLRYIPDPEILEVEGNIRHTLLTTSLVSTQTLVVKRAEFKRVGGFDANMLALEDWDLALRLAELGPFAFVDEMLVIQRFSPNSITGDRQKWITARLQFIDKHRSQFAACPDLLSRQYQVLAGQYRRVGQIEDARDALRKAREITPGSAAVWTRTAALSLSGALHRIGLQNLLPDTWTRR